MSTFTKIDLVKATAHRTGLLQCDTEKTVEALLAEITTALAGGHRVEFRGFGVWDVRLGKARIGRIPCKPDSEPIQIPARPTLRFKPSKDLKAAVRSISQQDFVGDH
jgi:nucleoid DNA-binding protein